MSSTSVTFKELGICELVQNLQLSELGNHIAEELRDMTAQKRTHDNGRPCMFLLHLPEC